MVGVVAAALAALGRGVAWARADTRRGTAAVFGAAGGSGGRARRQGVIVAAVVAPRSAALGAVRAERACAAAVRRAR